MGDLGVGSYLFFGLSGYSRQLVEQISDASRRGRLVTGLSISRVLPHLQPWRSEHVGERRCDLRGVPGTVLHDMGALMTLQAVPQDRQRPREPRRRVRTLHAPLA